MNLRFADKGDMKVTGKEAFMLALGVIGSSRKEHEQRLPLERGGTCERESHRQVAAHIHNQRTRSETLLFPCVQEQERPAEYPHHICV